MPRFPVAHIHEQGNDMIIVPLESSFGQQSSQAQQETIAELQVRANAAGLRGTVVVVWDSGGRMAFIGPQLWRPFLEGLNLQLVAANLNKEIFW
jgi:hypothetical protein